MSLNSKLTTLDLQPESHFQYLAYISKSFQMNLYGDWFRQAVYLMQNNVLLFYRIDKGSKECIQFDRAVQLDSHDLHCRQVHWIDERFLMLECFLFSGLEEITLSYLRIFDTVSHTDSYIGSELQIQASSADPKNVFLQSVRKTESKHTIVRGYHMTTGNSTVHVYDCQR